MAAMVKFLCIGILSGLIMGGNSKPCSEKDLIITQSATGEVIQGKPQWNVKITNNCICTQQSVKLSCDGFQTVENIDAAILKKIGSECLLNGGAPIYGNKDFSFSYAWSNSFPFKTLFSQVSCS